MKIKKTFQGELPENRIVNTYSNSLTDAYSANYLNDKLKSVEVSSTEPTSGKDIWVQMGKNLFDKTKIISNLSPTSDGGFTGLNGCYTSYVKVEPGLTYMVSSNVNRPWVFNFAKDIPAVGVVATPWNIANGTAFQVTVPDGFEYISFRHLDTSEGEDNINQDIQIEQGELKTDYEPYMPKKIYVKKDEKYELVYDEANIRKEVYVGPYEPKSGEDVWIQSSNNLFNIEKASLAWLLRNGNEISFNDAVYYGELRYNYDFEINKPYTFSFNILETSVTTYASVLFFYADGSYSENTINNTVVGKYSATFTPTKKVNFLELRFFRLNNNTTQRTGKVTDIQIEQGSTATNYEPYVTKKIYTKNFNGFYEELYDERSSVWKEADTDYDNSTVTIPINWNELKEISFRVLGTESATFGYVTIPKEQWHDNGTYGVLVNCINGAGGIVGYRRFWVSQKNQNNFIIKFDGNATNVSVCYK